MLRLAALPALILTLNVVAADAEDRPDWLPKTLNEWLAHEDRGTFDHEHLEPAELIHRATERFSYYNAVWCETGEQVQQMKACLRRVLDRHVEKARERVREAEATTSKGPVRD